MINRSLLYPNKRLKHSTNSDVYNLLNGIFNVSYAEGSEVRNNILVVLLFTSYISASDLSYCLGMPEASYKSLHKQLNDLVKKGFLKTTNTGVKDGFTKTLYYLTETGFYTAVSLLESADNADFKFKRRGKAITTMHDYSIGLNALQLILYGQPFSWAKEKNYTTSAMGGKFKGSLCIDGEATFGDGKKVFIEEDLGTETTGTLVTKLEKYYNYELLSNPSDDALIFSFRKPHIICEGVNYPAYSYKAFQTLLDTLNGRDMTVTDYYNELLSKGSRSEDDNKDIALIKHIGRIYGVIDKKGVLFKDIPYAELNRLYTDIYELKSDERVIELNIPHEDFTKARMRSMVGILCKKYRQTLAGQYIEPFLLSLCMGQGVYCLSTNLISNYMPYIFWEHSSIQHTIGFILQKIYPGINPAGYTPLLPYTIKNTSGIRDSVTFRNAMPYSNGYVCVENISRDIGAIIRIKRFCELYIDSYDNIRLLCLVDDVKDALFYSGEAFMDIPDNSSIIFLDLGTLKRNTPHFFKVNNNQVVDL